MVQKKVSEKEWKNTYQERMWWLKKMDRRPGDVMTTEDGREYVYDNRDENGKCSRVYVPADLFLLEIERVGIES